MSESRADSYIFNSRYKTYQFLFRAKVERNQEKQTIKLFQPTYIDKISSKSNLNKAHSTTTLMKKFALLQLHIESQATVAKKKETKA